MDSDSSVITGTNTTQTYKQSLPGLTSVRALNWFVTLCCRLLAVSVRPHSHINLCMFYSFLITGFSGLAEAPGVAGRPPRREIRRVGPPASRQANPTVWKLIPGGQHQDFLVRDLISIILSQICIYRLANKTNRLLPLCPSPTFPHMNVCKSMV